MHIAIDARNLLTTRNGIGRSLLEICRELCKRDSQITLCWPNTPDVVPEGIVAATNCFSSYRGGLGRFLWSFSNLPHQIKKCNPDIFWGPSHRLPANLDPSIPRVVTIHDLVWAKYPQTMRRSGWLADRILAPHAMKRADAIIAVSNATRDDIIERFPKLARKVHVIYPGASTLAVENTNGSKSKWPDMIGEYALFVGTHEPRKNLKNLFSALAILKRERRIIGKLRVVGGKGWRHANINDLISHYGLGDCVDAVGFVSDAELEYLYRNARILVMPSLYEGFGLPIIEAGRYGVPSLCSNISSMPEAAGKAGLLVNPLNPVDIANGWRRLWEDDALYNELSSHARENAARFSWKSNVDTTLRLFESLLSNSR